MALTSLSLSVLALLTEGPMHPYEMYSTLIERREDKLVKIRPGSLYHTVERLARDELVLATGTDREGNRPERTTYAVTAAGRWALREQLTDLLRTPAEEYPLFPFAIGEAHNLEKTVTVELLTEYVDGLDAQIGELGQGLVLATDRGVEEAYLINIDYLRAVKVAERAWISTLIDRINTEDLPWPHHQSTT